MNIITPEDEKWLLQKYGKAIFELKEKTISLNQRYFAARFGKLYHILYYRQDDVLYLYNFDDGAWTPKNYEFIQEKVADMLHSFASKSGCQDQIDAKITAAFLSSVVKIMKGMYQNTNAFSERLRGVIHCANGMAIYDHETNKWSLHKFAPEYFSRNRNPIVFDPNATCPDFLEKLLRPAMTGDDIELLQYYFGQCLLGENTSQTFLYCSGTASGGKSTLINIIEGTVGRWNCTELRLEHMDGRFEIGRSSGKTLLTAKDVDSEFLSSVGARKLKALTGNDAMSLEHKNSNSVIDVIGNFNVIIVSNAQLRLEFDGDAEAWRRRILWIRFDRPPVAEKIPNFDRILLKKEGSGILNWALAGAAKLLSNGGKIVKSAEQIAKIDLLIKSANPVDVFIKLFVKPDPDATVSSSEAMFYFKCFCDVMKWPQLADRKIQHELKEAMRSIHHASLRTDVKRQGKNVRGYYYFRVAPPVNQA
ncbi:MAG: DUF5906 domain-containing protein [Victivallaceae bacterium]|jgi:putative DNA primase/helicase